MEEEVLGAHKHHTPFRCTHLLIFFIPFAHLNISEEEMQLFSPASCLSSVSLIHSRFLSLPLFLFSHLFHSLSLSLGVLFPFLLYVADSHNRYQKTFLKKASTNIPSIGREGKQKSRTSGTCLCLLPFVSFSRWKKKNGDMLSK